MTVQELIDQLSRLDDYDVEVEIATQPNFKDEWYEIVDLELTTNHRGRPIVVINTD